MTIHAIASQLGIDDNTVRHALAAEGDPRPLRRRRPTRCIFEGCNRPRASKVGYCYGHARQLRLTGEVKPFRSRLNQQQEARQEREQAVFALRSTGLTWKRSPPSSALAQQQSTGRSALRATRAHRSSRGRSDAALRAATGCPTTALMAIAQRMKSDKSKGCLWCLTCCAHPTVSGRPASLRAASGLGATKTATAPAMRGNCVKPEASHRRSSRE